MSNKFTIDTIKDLKVKVKEMNETLLSYYTQDEFKPDNSFHPTMEQSEVPFIDDSLINQMLLAFEQNETEFEAGKLLFETLKLNPKQASDIGFWTYHNHYTFYKYIAKRWGDVWNDEKKVIDPSTYIIDHWIQSNSSQAGLIRYPISGLWWSFYLTIDNERNDKYELTRLFFKNDTLRLRQLGTARFARHKPAILAVLEFIKENNLSLEKASNTIVPYVNLLGGIRPLSYFDKDWFKSKLEKRFGVKKEDKELANLKVSHDKNNEQSNSLISKKKSNQFDKYFCLNSKSGNYLVSSEFNIEWNYCIGLNSAISDQYLVHFYKEGKIKKSNVNNILNKAVDRSKPFSNGKCQKLTLIDVKLITQPVLFGIAYKTRYGIYFKAMDEQNLKNFRIDNSEIHQEGKKVLYIDESFQTAFKILPYKLKDDLGTLLQQSPTSNGAEITNKYYESKWRILNDYWPELFNDTIVWA